MLLELIGDFIKKYNFAHAKRLKIWKSGKNAVHVKLGLLGIVQKLIR